jgi:hypothetical protein
MEARDDGHGDGRRVRPVPLDDVSGVPAIDESGTAPRPRKRPWIPLLLAVAGIAVVVTSVSVFGALQFDDPEPPADDEFAADTTGEDGSTTTATTLPPRLDELLPQVTDRLTLIAVRDGTLHALLWDPSFREPRAVDLHLEETPAASFTGAWFDRSGRQVAVERCGPLRCDLFVGSPTDLGTEPDLTDVISFAWHASEIGRIAWVTSARDGYTILAGDVNPLSGRIEDVTPAFTVAEPVRIVQWDGTGFIVQNTGKGSAARATAYDPAGVPLWERTGTVTTATDRIAAVATVLDGDDGGEGRAVWSLVDRSTGAEVDEAGTIEPTSVFVGSSESADLVAQLSARASGPYSLRVSGGSMSAQRIVTVQQRYAPIGFTDDGTYFMLVDGERNLVFVDWNRTASHEVVAPDGYRILGLDLG